MMLQIGSKVRVKQNAYEGSDDPDDFLARGKAGAITPSQYVKNAVRAAIAAARGRNV